MSTQYTTEPPPTATVLLHTTAGPLTLSLFAVQTPLTSRNFLQHVLDGIYTNTLFHRISPGFVIQTGDPTGTGEGGTNIYDDGDRDLEHYGETWGKVLRLPEEKYGDRIVLGNEFHSRLKFNRRGLVGMARMTESRTGAGQYGSQFFITLADCRAELDGKCTMFGRIEGEGIYSVMKIAEGERIEGTERAVFPEKILRAEVVEMPRGAGWDEIKPRERIAARTIEVDEKRLPKKTAAKKKNAKALLSFGDEEDMSVVVKPKKAKFNTTLIDGPVQEVTNTPPKTAEVPASILPSNKKRKSPSPHRDSAKLPEPQSKRRKPSFHDSATQLPLRDPEYPSRSPSIQPEPELPNRRRSSMADKSSNVLEAEIAKLKASMKRDTGSVVEKERPTSALQAMIPANSTRGRRRPKAGESLGGGKTDSRAMNLLNAFRSRLEKAELGEHRVKDASNGHYQKETEGLKTDAPDEEAALCDLHFIANCQSCSDWQDGSHADEGGDEEADEKSFLAHALTFEKDRLGKDLTWKRKNEEELVVIDPREREKELGIKGKHKDKHRGDGGREWDVRVKDKTK